MLRDISLSPTTEKGRFSATLSPTISRLLISPSIIAAVGRLREGVDRWVHWHALSDTINTLLIGLILQWLGVLGEGLRLGLCGSRRHTVLLRRPLSRGWLLNIAAQLSSTTKSPRSTKIWDSREPTTQKPFDTTRQRTLPHLWQPNRLAVVSCSQFELPSLRFSLS
jgi:hypothetical protein